MSRSLGAEGETQARARSRRIHASLSYPTCESWIPDPLFRISVKGCYRASMSIWPPRTSSPNPRCRAWLRHRRVRSPSAFLSLVTAIQAEPSQGRFVPSKFENIFSQYDTGNKGGLTYREGLRMVRGNRNVADPFGASSFRARSTQLTVSAGKGWLAAPFEWTLTYLLVWPQDGILPKEAIRATYDDCLALCVSRLVS